MRLIRDQVRFARSIFIGSICKLNDLTGRSDVVEASEKLRRYTERIGISLQSAGISQRGSIPVRGKADPMDERGPTPSRVRPKTSARSRAKRRSSGF